MEWKNTDPRYDINKRATIVILRKTIDGNTASIAFVETKEEWSIYSHRDNIDLDVDDNWDPNWYWSFFPEVSL
jgi:hypothetical protein